ncbi:Cyclin-related protein [Musa troglodytarum]|uniref:Cyclin-related protein n=1 Tax=Musa troglodytarum TaxID=320322 RepID=A0A9E7K6P8_9LILI|nr:Cyclin-related protein [Musa troglodytarum]
MGVMSRKVVPACGVLCFLCPSLRERSRQPVKRYKKLLADIFPRSQIVSAVLENYGVPKKKSEDGQQSEEVTQSRWVQEVLKTEGHSEISTIKTQLLSDFVPDDVGPLRAQFVETSGQISPFESKKENTQEVTPPNLIDFDNFPEGFETVTDHSQLANGTFDLLSVDQLLETVLETAWPVGRFSASSTSDVPFKEMAGHCEALMMGKQQKMSVFTSAQQNHDILFGGPLEELYEEKKSSFSNTDQSEKSGNPFLDEKLCADLQRQFCGNNMILNAEFHNQPQYLRLPASSPYDNFLKAAGC